MDRDIDLKSDLNPITHGWVGFQPPPPFGICKFLQILLYNYPPIVVDFS